MLLIQDSMKEKDAKKLEEALDLMEEKLSTMTSIFVENYLPAKLVSNARKSFKNNESYICINSKSKKLNSKLKTQYSFELKEVPNGFKPITGKGHQQCKVFCSRIKKDSKVPNQVTVDSVNHKSVSRSTSVDRLSQSVERSIDRRSQSVETLSATKDAKPLTVTSSKQPTIVSTSKQPTVVPSTSTFPKKISLSLKGLIDSSIATKTSIKLEEPDPVRSSSFTSIVDEKKSQEIVLQDWIVKNTDLIPPNDSEVRSFAIDFLKE